MDNKTRFSKEDMNTLRRAQIHFESVLKESTLRGAQPSLTKTIAKIYENTFKQKLNRNYNCNVCAFSIYRIVGQAYFKQLEEDQLKNVKDEDKSNEEPKPTKKKKIDK